MSTLTMIGIAVFLMILLKIILRPKCDKCHSRRTKSRTTTKPFIRTYDHVHAIQYTKIIECRKCGHKMVASLWSEAGQI